MAIDFKDFYILDRNHPRYERNEIIEDEVLDVILQKYEMVIFTNKGELLGVPNFGANLEELLFSTKVSDKFVKETIQEQIAIFIPELADRQYTLDVAFVQDPYNFQDIMYIYLRIGSRDVYAQIGRYSMPNV